MSATGLLVRIMQPSRFRPAGFGRRQPLRCKRVAPLTSGRESFSPDASYFLGPFPANSMRFLVGPPVFAVEVRSESDYGVPADLARAAKRADYFEAGTLVVWDVDPIADRILKYRSDAPEQPEVFIRGQVADAEPAVPNWTIAVDSIFA
jgi:Uma2 family endonuclease